MSNLQTTTFAGGCFWCFETIFKRLKGVEEVMSGYAGGRTENPDYEEVSTGNSGHAEAVQIKFDPNIISYKQLVEIFFRLHDPTTLNEQGPDKGEMYRSVIFYHSEEQRKIAEEEMEKFEKEKIYADPIVTEIIPYLKFYKAEEYHQDYYEQNKNTNPYCRLIVDPKIQKLYKNFKDKVKQDE